MGLSCRAHPRSRGENARQGGPITSGPGSSPLTRGKPPPRRSPRHPLGLIPAHAGKTSRIMKSGSDKTAHPRSRGENLAAQDPYGRETGSSPLTRGKPGGTPLGPPPAGLIPAHAGKTDPRSRMSRSWRAHPRSRGENAFMQSALNNGGGSSPLTRGKLLELHALATESGLIPAHAGKTPSPLL